MATAKIIAQARKMGHELATGRDVLPGLALAVAHAIVHGEIDSDDVPAVYEAYRTAGMRGFEEYDPASQTIKVQISKLRQIARLAEEDTRNTLDLLRRAADTHTKLLMSLRNRSLMQPMYAFMVDVARTQLAQTRKLTDAQLRKLAKR